MALKPDRVETLTDISFFMTAVATRGGVASVDTSGVGVSMDDGDAVVEYAALASGALPIGVLLNDVVNLDLTRQHLNYHKDETQVGGKVTLLSIGQVTTNMITGTPNAGEPAYVGPSGTISDSTGTDVSRIGTWLSAKDADGYAKVSIKIQ